MPTPFEPLIKNACDEFVNMLEADPLALIFQDLATVEGLAHALVPRLARALIQAFVDTRSRMVRRRAGRRRCLACSEPMEILKATKRPRQTLFGAIEIEDPYLYCRTCHESRRPLHSVLGIDYEKWSLAAQRIIVDLCADESCERAVKKLRRLFPDLVLDRSTARHFLNLHADEALRFHENRLAAVGAEETAPELLEVELDGSMVPVATHEEIPPDATGRQAKTPVRGLPKKAKKTRYSEVRLAVANGAEDRLHAARPGDQLDEIFRDTRELARLVGAKPEKTTIHAISDGAPYIRARLARGFSEFEFHFTLDRPHAKEHLHGAAEALHEGDEESAERWYRDALARMEHGDADDVVAELQIMGDERDDATLRREAGYFSRNLDAVEYERRRERGWSTASSNVESGHRHIIQARLKIAGAWWDPETVPGILALRVLKANGWWDEYWESRELAAAKKAMELRAA